MDTSNPTGYLTNVVAIAAGDCFTVALIGDGTARTWGYAWGGRLGDGSTTGRSLVPVTVMDPLDPTGFLMGVAAVAASGSHTLALLADGTVRSWGSGSFARLSGAGFMTCPTPVAVLDPSDPTGILRGVIAVAAGEEHSVALLDDGTLRAWGSNSSGQLGDGTTTDAAWPRWVLDPSDPSGFLRGVTALAAGRAHTLALQR